MTNYENFHQTKTKAAAGTWKRASGQKRREHRLPERKGESYSKVNEKPWDTSQRKYTQTANTSRRSPLDNEGKEEIPTATRYTWWGVPIA